MSRDDTCSIHGVFLDIFDNGVLLTGASGIGKSELALELVSRGHGLVADDAPLLFRSSPDGVYGTCPETLRGFLEVRGLGVLDVRRLFGDHALCSLRRLDFIIQLRRFSEREFCMVDRLYGNRGCKTLLGLDIPTLTLPVGTYRNLVLLVETAVRDQRLRMLGDDPGAALAARQKQLIRQDLRCD